MGILSACQTGTLKVSNSVIKSFRKFSFKLGLLLLVTSVSQQAYSQVVAWDFNGKAGNETTVAATTLDANLLSTSISRGAGINATTVSNTFAANNFTVFGTFADAVTNGQYFQFTIQPKPLYQALLSTLDVNFRRSTTGPNNFQWQYSLDGFATAGINIGSSFTYNLTTGGGDPQTQIDLSSIGALQNFTTATTVTFRLYAWGATNTGGTFALGRPSSPLNDLAIGGTVILLPVHNLTQNTHYNTIQAAINAANNNDVIAVDPGTYTELLTINKTLTFQGNNVGTVGTGTRSTETILVAPGAGPNRMINLSGSVSATFDGFLIDGTNVAAISAAGQSLVLQNNIVELDFTDNDNNIYFNSNSLTLNRNYFKAINGTNTTGASSHIFVGASTLTATNNKFTSVDAIDDLTGGTTSLPVWLNLTTGLTSAAVNNNEFTQVDIGILLASNASNVTIENNDFDQTKRKAYTGGSTFGAGIAIFNTLTPFAPINIRNNNFKNSETGIRTSSSSAGQSFPADNMLSIGYNSFTGISDAAILVSSDYSASTTKLKALCNWYDNITGPTITGNTGASGGVINAPAGKVSFANWLNYGTDASPNLGFQLPTSLTLSPGSNTSVAENHYRVLSNGIGCLVSNQTLTLSGTFDFANATAMAEWAKGNNQIAGDGMGIITGSGDDYSITAPDSTNNVTITAASLGSATVRGPGDLAVVALESPLYFNNNNATSSFQNWTISNLVFKDFDMTIGCDLNGGNTTAYNNLKILNNQIDIPEDRNQTFGGETSNFQNIGIYLGFGSNMEISGNNINIDGVGISDGTNYSVSVAIQSTTSGGTVYDGLKIKNNTVTVTGDPDAVAPSVIRGFWENGHNKNAAIELSGNKFLNANASNTADLNRQTAFWVTSRSGAAKKVEYKNNEVSGFNEGIAWMGGAYTLYTPPDYEADATPVEIKNNTFDKNKNSVVVRKSLTSPNAGSPGYIENNSFTNAVTGGFAIKNEGTGDAQSVCNWYGTTSAPVAATMNNGPVYLASILNSGVDGNPATGFQPSGTCIVPPVHNVTQNIYYTTIQAGVNGAVDGDQITVESGTYNEQVLVNKKVELLGIGATSPVVDFTGTVSGKPTLFDVSVDNVKIDNFHFNVDLSKLKSAVIVSGTDIDNIIINNNLVDAYGTPASGTYGDRNAFSINYSGPTNYRVATGGVNSITFTNNTVNGSAPTSFFRAGVAVDEGGGSFTGNTLQTINHDLLVRFGSNGPVTISNNNFNGGGVELSDQNAGAGTITVTNNTFNGTFAISSAPGSAILRVRNNYNGITHNISNNTFNAYDWAVSLENMNNITLNANTFNTSVANAHAIVVNTKSISTNSNTIVQVPVAGTFTNNNFNGTGNAFTFANHDNDNAAFGTFTLGTAGNENNFAAALSSFVVFDGQTGPSGSSTFPAYTSLIGSGGGAGTTMACWNQNLDIQNNKMDVGAGLQLPASMNFAQRTTLESKLTHKPDNSCLGLMAYFMPVHNLTQNTYYFTIQDGVNAANPSDVIECAAWEFNERVVIDKSLTLQGVDSTNTILNGAGLSGNGNGITINSGVTNVTIKKLRVKNYTGLSGNANAGIYGVGGNDNLLVDEVAIWNNVGGSGFYANGPVNNVTITHCTATGHTVGARGIVIWNGLKSNINISDNHVFGNNCCGIELQDGTATGVTMNNNNVHNNGDNGIGAVGLMGTGANVISNNTVTDNGRFGIEIKNPDGSGAPSGSGSIVISNNTVSRTVPIVTEQRDLAGIAVFRRGVLAGNVDVPTGVQVLNNNVSGYQQPSTSDGFGIVVEGLNHTVSGNTLNGNDVGIQRQAGHLPYPGDGDQSNLADQYFGRGNSPITCGVTVSGNTFSGNTTDTRDVGNSFGDGIVTNTNTGKSYCSIQAAINDPLTLNGHIISASAGTYNEDVLINKEITLQGAGNATTTIVGQLTGSSATVYVAAQNVVIDGFTITRAGNNVAQWNTTVKTAGIAVQGSNFAEIRNNNITGNRTGIDVNNSNGNNIHNNIIDDNRTGLIFRNQTDNTNLQQNFIRNNWTIGVLFLDASGGSNTPPQQAQSSTFNNNNISGNWYGDVQDRQSGGSLPAPGYNLKNFDCNWYGQPSAPVVSNANSTEPGYSSQIPVAFGGTATPPPSHPNILGTASANLDFINWLVNGTDDQPGTTGFQPVPGSCTGVGPVLNVNTGQTYLTIQSAINNPLTQNGHTIQVAAGTYAENVVVTKELTILGPNANIDPCSGSRNPEAIVVPATSAIASGEVFHVAASNVTISGFTIDGDNTALTSGHPGTNSADIDAAEAITVYETNINNLKATYNIIQNLSYFGVTLYDYPAGVASSGHEIRHNLIQNMGTYDASSGIDLWGGGVLLYNNQYAAVTDNCITNVRTGIQTGNFYTANPGANTYQVISNNTISTRRRGIFHNLFYSAASPFTVSNNTITGVNNTNETGVWDGMLIASMQATASTISGNNINGSGITDLSRPTTGISVWNDQVAPAISGGTITGVKLGINVNNYEGYNNSNANNTLATIDGVTITNATEAGIRVHDNPANTNNATVSAEIKGNTNITGSAIGILVLGSDASANVHDNASSITGGTTGVEVNAGTITQLFRNNISSNTGDGVRVLTGGKINSITENFIKNNGSGIKVESDAGTMGNVTSNDLSGNTGLALNNLAATALNANCNWYGSSDGNVVFAKVSTNVNYLPYLTDGTDDQPGTNGFQPLSGVCNGPGNFYVNDNNTGDDLYTTAVGNDANAGTASAPFLTIQKALMMAGPGNTIYVDGGVYQTQLDINKSITIVGAGRSGTTTTRIKAPATPASITNANGSYQPIIYAQGAGNTINLDKLLIDGDGGRTISDFMGVYYFEAGGALTNSRVTGIRDATYSGNQSGLGVYVNHAYDANVPHTVTINNNIIDDYQKAGLVVNELNTHAVITGNTVTGQNIPNINGQNGIQLGYGAYATITGNTVTGNIWNSPNPHTWLSAGILLAGAGVDNTNTATGNATVIGGAGALANNLSGNETGVITGDGGSGYTNSKTVTYAGDIYANNKVHVYLDPTDPVNVPVVANAYDKRVDNPAQTNIVFGCIQYGVDFASAGNTLNVSGHTFNENVLVHTPVSIIGAGQANTFVKPEISAPNICAGTSLCPGSSNVFLVQANDVTIKDLTVDGDNPALTSGITVGGADIDARNGIITNHNAGTFNNLTVQNVTVKNVFLRGIYASSGGTFTFDNNTVTNVSGDPAGSIAMFNFGGAGVFSNNTVTNSNDGIVSNWSTGSQYFGNTVSNVTGAGIHTDNNQTTADLIHKNTVSNSPAGGYGIMVYSPYVATQVYENTITNVEVGIANARQNAAVAPVFSRNVIDGQSKANSVGIYQTTQGFGWGDTNVSGLYLNNFIQNNVTGLYLETQSGLTSNIVANDNSITGNTLAVDTTGTGTAVRNLTCNWWGVTGGNPLVTAVGKATNYAPWLHSGTDADLVTMGFQPLGPCSYDADLYVNDGSNNGNFYTTTVGSDANPGVPAAPFLTINKAIASAAATGNTIWVDPGNYPENVVVNKEVNIKGRWAGSPVAPRFGAFVSLKADPDVESIITAPVSDPASVTNDLVKVLANNVTIDGFTLDGNNPALTGTSTVTDGSGLDIDARRGIINRSVADAIVDVNNLKVKNNILQNLSQRGVNLYSTGTSLTGNLIESNIIRNYGLDPVNGGQAVILFTNAYADITNNTVDVTDNNIGLHLQNFYSNGTMTWSNNNVTTGQDAIGIHANLFYAPAGVLNIQNNTVNARTGVTGASDYTWGINVWSVQAGSTVNVSNNTVGNSGGEFGRGINLWNLPTSSTVTVSGGTVGNSLVGINLDNVDPYFGVGSNTMVNVTGNPVVTVGNGQIGIRARSAMVNTVVPNGSTTLVLNKATVVTSGTAIGVVSDAPTASTTNMATVYLSGGTDINGGSITPVLINGNQAQVYAGLSNIVAPASGANNTIQFSNITAANTRENLVIAGGTTINMNGNTAARAIASPQYSIVEMAAASGWTVPAKISGGQHTMLIDGSMKFSNGILSTAAVADTILFGNNATDIMTGAWPEKATSYILGRAKMLSRAVNNGAVDMLGANLGAQSGAAADVGNLVITRTTTNAGAITPVFPGGQSIRTVWNIIPSNGSASRASVQYRYLNIGTNINGQNPASIYGYRYVGGTWNKISASLNSILVGDVYTTDAFGVPGFSPWTLSSQATAYLPDFTPLITMGVGGFGFTNPPSAGSSKDFMVTIQEVGNASSTGQVVFRITKSSNYTITWSNVSGTSNVPGPTANNNSDWDFTQDPTYIYVTLKTGGVIPAFGTSKIGFTITRNTGVAVNSNTSLTVRITSGSGGDSNSSNNSKSGNLLAQ